MTRIDYIFVDDGSIDSTLNVLKKIQIVSKKELVIYHSLEILVRKQRFMLDKKSPKAEYVAVMDADLQDPPRIINSNEIDTR